MKARKKNQQLIFKQLFHFTRCLQVPVVCEEFSQLTFSKNLIPIKRATQNFLKFSLKLKINLQVNKAVINNTTTTTTVHTIVKYPNSGGLNCATHIEVCRLLIELLC